MDYCVTLNRTVINVRPHLVETKKNRTTVSRKINIYRIHKKSIGMRHDSQPDVEEKIYIT